MKAGKKLVQVGFMRRYDEGYKQLKAAVDSGKTAKHSCCTAHTAIRPFRTIGVTPWQLRTSWFTKIHVLRWLLGED